jgi:hypothetical protein
LIWLTVGDKVKSLRNPSLPQKWVLLLVMNQRCCLLVVMGMQDMMHMNPQSAQRPQLQNNNNGTSSSKTHSSSSSISKTAASATIAAPVLAPTTASATAAKATAIAMTATRLAATWEHPAVVDCNGS